MTTTTASTIGTPLGMVEIFDFTNYEELLSKFLAEVHELRTRWVEP